MGLASTRISVCRRISGNLNALVTIGAMPLPAGLGLNRNVGKGGTRRASAQGVRAGHVLAGSSVAERGASPPDRQSTIDFRISCCTN
ncbi:hypothetical protein B0T16DRAFT_406427 [Cercophora newfieldiana]|uniref:Uncharacterized protein n=1 Tax=Cercophora newfieldiana TaxID=92897 RepID=A0AA40CV45_9PEZI|nr:hypothetical protein B0T16DRAFT_406427 [Cercophora newfieldiana]